MAVEGLAAALDAAREQPGAETAAFAKATAGRASQVVVKHSSWLVMTVEETS